MKWDLMRNLQGQRATEQEGRLLAAISAARERICSATATRDVAP